MEKNSAVTLSYHNGKETIDLPLMQATLGPDVMDIRSLGQTGMFTFDPGFLATASCESKITFIDGDKGQLYYRGYPIEELAENSDYLEVCYLLVFGELPTKEQKKIFEETIKQQAKLDQPVEQFFQGFHKEAHPMGMMVGVVGALSALYQEGLDLTNQAQRDMVMYRLIAKIPTIAAMCYRHHQGLPFLAPRDDLSYTANFLYMMFADAQQNYTPSSTLVRALDCIFMLHADHEQNASTSTVRLAGSSGANPFACIAAGIACLWGPAHGGANEAVLKMLGEIGSEERIEEYIAGVKAKKYRLMGFGHRVYKNMDPRADVIRGICYEVLKEQGLENDTLFKLAMRLEKVALSDPYFIEKKLYPNVDFYSGIVLKALGIPVAMFTVIFALARTVGWISHWAEMISDPQQKIGRPRQLYRGAHKREYLPVEQRSQS